MPLTATEKTGTNIEPIEPGVYTAVCYGLVDLGHHVNPKFNKEAHKVLIQWELPACRAEFERDGAMVELPRVVSKRMTLSLHEKADLRKDLESWRGRKFTAQELAGFDLQQIIGAGCQLQIIHETGKDGKTYANISAIMSLPRGTKAPPPENPVCFFSWEDHPEGVPPLPPMPEWVAGIIMESREWKERTMAPTSTPPPATEVDPTGVPAADDLEEIPF